MNERQTMKKKKLWTQLLKAINKSMHLISLSCVPFAFPSFELKLKRLRYSKDSRKKEKFLEWRWPNHVWLNFCSSFTVISNSQSQNYFPIEVEYRFELKVFSLQSRYTHHFGKFTHHYVSFVRLLSVSLVSIYALMTITTSKISDVLKLLCILFHQYLST